MNSIKSEVYSKGKLVSSNIASLDIIKSVNKIPYAQVVICEGGGDNKSIIEMSNDDCFKPGEEIEIALSNKDDTDTFKGIVIKHNIKKTQDGTLLTVDIKDNSLKLTLQRKSVVFKDKEDKQIIVDIAKNKDIDVECSEKTYTHKQIVQYYCTDWDFIISRAEANGLLVYAENGKLIIKKPDFSSASKKLANIYEFEMEADMSTQFKEIESVCWDIKNVECGKFKNTNNITLEGKHDYNTLSELMGTDTCAVVNGVYSEKEEMEQWANARMIKNRLSMLRGRVSVHGNPNIKLGDTIKISESGDIFDSTTIVTGIRHRINTYGWTTDIQCGLSPNWFYTTYPIIDKPAAGLIPGINGLQVGIVEAFPSDGDPEKFHRIKVKIPAIDEQEGVIWARLILPYAGKERGIFFIPEVGDEVVVGFFNDDPRHAVVLGSLYNGKTETPLDFTEENNEKGIITKSGIKIVLNDEKDKEKIEIDTPAGNKVLIEDENGITIEDKNENHISLHDKGISLKDKNSNKIETDENGILFEDTNKNGLLLDKQGVEFKDANGNTVTLSSAGIEIKDMNGNKVALEASGITIKSGAKVVVNGATIDLN